MATIADSNQFSALSTPSENEAKSWENAARSAKDDAKEQAYQAKSQMKGKAADLKAQVVAGASRGLQLAKSKAAELTGRAELEDASNEELADAASETAQEGWAEIKKRGGKAAQEGAKQLDAKLNEKLTPQQRQKLNKGVRQAQAVGKQAQARAEGLFGSVMSAPQLRPARRFIERNNLQLPVMILGAILTLWLSLSVIRLITTATTPKVPEFDIHSKEASMNWLKWHAGEYKDKAVDMRESLAGRAAAFLANHEVEKMQEKAINWRDIGINKLGLAEPTWSEWLLSYVTGRPTTWQGRVMSVLDLAKTGLHATQKAASIQQGIASAALKTGYDAVKGAVGGQVRDKLHMHEPTLMERATNYVTGRDASLQGRMQDQASSLGDRVGSAAGDLVDSIRNTIPGLHKAAPVEPEGVLDSLKHKLADGVNTIREHIPGSEAAEAARLRAYAAAHPSTVENIKSGAEYIKNRVVHGAEEAKHRAQDRANRVIDEAKYKTGL